MKNILKYFSSAKIGIVISAVFLWLVLRKVDADSFINAFLKADPLLVLIAFAFTIVICAVRLARWRVLFYYPNRIPTGGLFSILMIGFLSNNVLPARLGDIVMSVLFHRKYGLGKSRSLGTILLDRLFDVIALVSMMCVVLLFQDLPDWGIWSVKIGLLATAVAIILLILQTSRPEQSKAVMEKVAGLFGARFGRRIMQFYVMALEGAGAFARPWRVLVSLILSFAIWLGLGFGVYILFVAQGLELGFVAAMIVVCIVNLGLIIPSSPGFIGTFQFFCVAALGIFGVDSSTALGFSVIYHLSQWLPTTLVGYFCLARENFGLQQIARSESA